MTTPLTQVRLSPSGKRIGNPPLQVGPGSLGLVFRKHGEPSAGDAAVAMNTATTIAIPGLDDTIGAPWSVSLKPGYRYDLQVEYEVFTQGVTATVAYSTWYRLRDKATGVYGAWVQFPGLATNPHSIYGSTTQTSTQRHGSDALFGLSVTAEVDRIQVGFLGNATTIQYYPEHAFARCAEYMP